MLGHRELTIEEYLEIAWRRIWVILIPTVLIGAVTFGYSLTIQDRYTSQTLVLVEQQKVPDRFVTPVVTDALNQRLGTMREQILSRSRLQPLIDRYPVFSEQEKAQMPLEDLINALRSAISVTPVQTLGPGGRDGLPGFYISFTWSDPYLAQQICQQITSMFMEENLKWRESRAQQTTAFLQKQLDEAKQKLDEEDARLAEFKRRYIGQLPGQEQTNLNLLMGMNTQLDAVTQLINRAQQEKSFAETQLQQQLAAWQTSQTGTNPRTLEDQLAQKKKELIDLEARYTQSHPDVTRLKQTIADLERRIAEAEANPPDDTEAVENSKLIEPPQIQQLRNQISQLELTIREKTREQERLQEQIKIYQARVQLSPVIEQQYKELTRDYDTALKFYNDLLAKKAQSEMGQALERDQQGEQFRVMDPANLPERPSYPNRLQFALGGLLAGLVFGGGIAVLLEIRDKSIRNERDIQALLGLPTLALLPVVEESVGKRRPFWKKRRTRMRHSSNVQQVRV